jgi:hypothetical protein
VFVPSPRSGFRDYPDDVLEKSWRIAEVMVYGRPSVDPGITSAVVSCPEESAARATAFISCRSFSVASGPWKRASIAVEEMSSVYDASF